MSRIGRAAITVPAGVTISCENDVVTVKGPLGELKQDIDNRISLNLENGVLQLTRANDEKEIRAKHGLYRALINNMVVGVTKGYTKSLVINGVGYKVQMQGDKCVLNIGFSHPVTLKAVPGITLACDKSTVIIKGIDKELVGQFAAKVRNIKPVEPYHAYGISYTDEVVVRKEVKSGKK